MAAVSVLLLHALLFEYPNLGAVLNAEPTAPRRVFTGLAGIIHALSTWTPIRLIWAGQEAVLVFFVLSGYVLSLDYLDGKGRPWSQFLALRICRLYLPYIAAIGMAFVARECIVNVGHRAEHLPSYWGNDVSAGLIFDQIFMLGRPSANILDPPTWSLVHEMRISIIFPLLVLITIRLPSMIVLMASVALALVLQKYTGALKGELLNSLVATLDYLFLFVFGIAAARHRATIATQISRLGAPTFTALLVLFLVLLNARSNFGTRVADHQFVTLFLVGLGATGLIALAASPGPIKTALEARPLVWMGKISFSLYLTHFLLVLSLTPVFGLAAGGVLTLLLCVPVAALFHAFIERPSLLLGRRCVDALANSSRPRPSKPASTSC